MRAKLSLLASGALLVPLTAAAFPWSDDMRDQPSVKPQEAIVELPAASVPVNRGKTLMPAPEDISELVRLRLRAAEIQNPVQPDEASLARGQFVYATHCQVCHGEQGRGDGPVGQKYVPTPIDLTIDYIQNQPDGRLYYTITYGGVVMPYYRDAIGKEDRWHLVNYLKHVIGKQ